MFKGDVPEQIQSVLDKQRFFANIIKLPGRNGCWVWWGPYRRSVSGLWFPQAGKTRFTDKLGTRTPRVIVLILTGQHVSDARHPIEYCSNESCVRPDHFKYRS